MVNNSTPIYMVPLLTVNPSTVNNPNPLSESKLSQALEPRQRNGVFFGEPSDQFIRVIYILLTIINFIGNGIVILLMAKYRQLRTTANYLLFNLSISDIVAGLAVYPYIFVSNISKLSTNQADLRIICSFTEGLSIFFVASGVGLLTLCAVSFYRYCIIRFPLRAVWTRSIRIVKLQIAFTWTISITFILPSAVSYHYSRELDVCDRQWNNINPDVYRSVTLLVTMVFPCTFMFLCYFALRRARRNISLRRISARGNRIKMMKRSERLVSLLMVNFVVCWMPFLLYWGIAAFTSIFPKTFDGQTYMMKWLRITVLFAVINGTVDPFLLAASSKEFREKAKVLFSRVVRVGNASTTVIRIRVKRFQWSLNQ